MTTEVEGEGGRWGVATLKLPTQKYSLLSGPRVSLQRGLIAGTTLTYNSRFEATLEISRSEAVALLV
jgi:hypothetical protein